MSATIFFIRDFLLQLEATENSAYLDMLRLFAHGTWNDYKSKHMNLPLFVICSPFFFFFFWWIIFSVKIMRY